MPFQKLQFKPGVNRENTRYANEGGWWSMDRVRFRSGTAESIGGWQQLSTNTFLGCCRMLWNWVTLGSENLLALGTNLKLYIERGGIFFDVTPTRLTTGALTNPFATTSGSAVVTFTYTAHGALVGDFVTFSGATGFNGIATTTLNAQYQIQSVPTANTLTVNMTTANATGSGGGATVVATFQMNTGPVVSVYGVGWGVGTWGGLVGGVATTGWGLAATGTGIVTQGMFQWVAHNFGQDLVCAPRGNTVYYWQPTTGGSITNALATPAATLASFVATAGLLNPPLFASALAVTDNQFLIIGGTNPVGSATYDPMTIRWCDEGNSFQWTPAITNQAGDMKLSSGSQIMELKKMRQEVAIWTDTAVISMQYVGAPVVFSFTTLSSTSSLVGPSAVAVADNVAYWMGDEKFYRYDGHVQTLPCAVRKYVFSNINKSQIAQTYAGVNNEFSEITWFYCSTNAITPDSYVTYNWLEDIWTFGTMARSAWLHSPLRPDPIAAGLDGYVYYHEIGVDDGSVSPAASLNSYIESADFDLGDGEHFSFVSRILPDVDFTNSTATTPLVTLTLTARDTPGSNFIQSNPRTVSQTSSTPFSQFTPMCYTRIRGRQIVYRLDCNTPGTAWQMGTPRLEIRPDGRR